MHVDDNNLVLFQTKKSPTYLSWAFLFIENNYLIHFIFINLDCALLKVRNKTGLDNVGAH
jgi:hypothetical protein